MPNQNSACTPASLTACRTGVSTLFNASFSESAKRRGDQMTLNSSAARSMLAPSNASTWLDTVSDKYQWPRSSALSKTTAISNRASVSALNPRSPRRRQRQKAAKATGHGTFFGVVHSMDLFGAGTVCNSASCGAKLGLIRLNQGGGANFTVNHSSAKCRLRVTLL